MKRVMMRAWWIIGTGISVLSSLAHAHATTMKEEFSFESPFPACTYKKLLDASVGVWGYMQMLQEKDLIKEDVEVFCDAIVGRMTQIPIHTETLINECYQGVPLLTDDVEHLITLFKGIDNLYQDIDCYRDNLDQSMELLSMARKQLTALVHD